MHFGVSCDFTPKTVLNDAKMRVIAINLVFLQVNAMLISKFRIFNSCFLSIIFLFYYCYINLVRIAYSQACHLNVKSRVALGFPVTPLATLHVFFVFVVFLLFLIHYNASNRSKKSKKKKYFFVKKPKTHHRLIRNFHSKMYFAQIS